MDSQDMSHIPSDEALEYLLAKTRAQFTEKVDDEAERLNQDLDALLYRVRGSRRASRSAALRAKAQSYIQSQREAAFERAQRREAAMAEHLSKESDTGTARSHDPLYAQHVAASHSENAGQSQIALSSGSNREVTPSESLKPSLTASDLRSIGVPDSYVALHVRHLDKMCSFIPKAPMPRRGKEGTIVAVVGAVDSVERTISIAEHLALRTPGNASIVLCGTKTLIPGQGLRARTSEELAELVEANPDVTYYAVLIDSSTHSRTIEKMIRENEVDHTWAVVNAMEAPETIRKWLLNLPGHLSAQALAFYHVWDIPMPGQMLQQSVPIGLLDTAPAVPGQWRLLFEAALTRSGSR